MSPPVLVMEGSQHHSFFLEFYTVTLENWTYSLKCLLKSQSRLYPVWGPPCIIYLNLSFDNEKNFKSWYIFMEKRAFSHYWYKLSSRKKALKCIPSCTAWCFIYIYIYIYIRNRRFINYCKKIMRRMRRTIFQVSRGSHHQQITPFGYISLSQT